MGSPECAHLVSPYCRYLDHLLRRLTSSTNFFVCSAISCFRFRCRSGMFRHIRCGKPFLPGYPTSRVLPQLYSAPLPRREAHDSVDLRDKVVIPRTKIENLPLCYGLVGIMAGVFLGLGLCSMKIAISRNCSQSSPRPPFHSCRSLISPQLVTTSWSSNEGE